MKDSNNVVRFILVLFLGFIGSFIVNHTSLKPQGWKSRTLGIFGWSIITFGIYGFVVAVCNLVFDSSKQSNIGYFKA